MRCHTYSGSVIDCNRLRLSPLSLFLPPLFVGPSYFRSTERNADRVHRAGGPPRSCGPSCRRASSASRTTCCTQRGVGCRFVNQLQDHGRGASRARWSARREKKMEASVSEPSEAALCGAAAPSGRRKVHVDRTYKRVCPAVQTSQKYSFPTPPRSSDRQPVKI